MSEPARDAVHRMAERDAALHALIPVHADRQESPEPGLVLLVERCPECGEDFDTGFARRPVPPMRWALVLPAPSAPQAAAHLPCLRILGCEAIPARGLLAVGLAPAGTRMRTRSVAWADGAADGQIAALDRREAEDAGILAVATVHRGQPSLVTPHIGLMQTVNAEYFAHRLTVLSGLIGSGAKPPVHAGAGRR